MIVYNLYIENNTKKKKEFILNLNQNILGVSVKGCHKFIKKKILFCVFQFVHFNSRIIMFTYL